MRAYVGCFDLKQLEAKDDEVAVRQAMERTGLQYVDTKLKKRNGEIVAIQIWVCDRDECLKEKEKVF